jgi:hypothetical protein
MRNVLRNDSSFERALAHRNQLGKRTKRKQQHQVESLEGRTLLTATLSVTSAGAVSFLSQTVGSTAGLSFNTGTDTYTFGDTEGVAPGAVDPAFTYTQVNGSEATLTPVAPATQNFTSLSFDQNVENITYKVISLDTPTSFVDTSLAPPAGTPLSDSFDFGATTGLAQSSITAAVSIALTKESAAITVDDSSDTTAQVINISSTQVDFNPTPAFSYGTTASVASLTVLGGSGGNTFNVNSTPGTGTTTLNKGSGSNNVVNVFATTLGSMLNLTGTGTSDTVNLGNGSVANLKGTLKINEAAGSTKMVINLSTDGLAHTLDLSSNGTTSTLHDELGNLPNDITYTTTSLASLEIDADGTKNQTLNLNFGAGGNPIPTASSAGLIYNAGNPAAGVSSALNISGQLPSGVFASEIHNANDPAVTPTFGQYGSIFFTDSNGVKTGLDYVGLQPITDTTPATNYTFNDFADDQSFTATSSTVPGFKTIQFANTPPTPPTFETTNVANKTNIVFNAPVKVDITNVMVGVVNIPTASTGLATLAFNTPNTTNNTVSFVATPTPGVGTPPFTTTSFVGGPGPDVTNVTGTGIAGVPTSTALSLNGAAGTNTLNYNAGGESATVASDGATGVFISIPGFGRVDATNYQQITITNAANAPPVISPGATLTGAANVPLINVVVATFTDTDTIENARSYTASINWGDGSTTAGSVAFTGTSTVGGLTVNDFAISGSHTYLAGSANLPGGSYATNVIVTDLGGAVSVNVGGAAVTATLDSLPPSAPSPGATVSVNALALDTTATVTATVGTPLVGVTLYTFTDLPNPLAASAYSATIDWGDGSAANAGTISYNSTTKVFSVSGSHTYTQGGTYAVSALIVGDGQQLTLTGTSATVAVTPLNGKLSPQSDTGISNTDGITSNTTPTFVGNTTPGTTVEVFATRSGSAVMPVTLIAIGAANSAGYWTATVNTPLIDGSYTITADAVNSSGTVLATASLGTVVIDTVGPVVTALTFDRFTDTVTVTYQDNLSGLAFASIANSAFYHLSAKPLANNVRVPKLLLPTAITITPGASPTSPEVVSVVFNNGHAVRGGRYLIVINSGAGDAGIHDVAGNALDGNFYGSFPSGDGLPGGNFAASIATFHKNIVLAPVPVQDGFVAPGAAKVDPPSHATTKNYAKSPKNVVQVPPVKVGPQLAKPNRVHDFALEALTTETKAKRHHG